MKEVPRGLLKVKSFARLSKQDPFTVYRKLWNGKIKGLRRSGHWLIPASQLSQLGKRGDEK